MKHNNEQMIKTAALEHKKTHNLQNTLQLNTTEENITVIKTTIGVLHDTGRDWSYSILSGLRQSFKTGSKPAVWFT